MDIKINDYYEPEHFKALNEADYDVSHSCDYEKNAMHHIHESTEILIVESGNIMWKPVIFSLSAPENPICGGWTDCRLPDMGWQ